MKKNRYQMLSFILIVFFSIVVFRRVQAFGFSDFAVIKKISLLFFYLTYFLGVFMHFYLKKNAHLNPMIYRTALTICRFVFICLFVFQW